MQSLTVSEDRNEVIVIGVGLRPESVKENGDIVIGNSSTLLRISRRGEVFLNGRLLGSDFEIYDGFKKFVHQMLNIMSLTSKPGTTDLEVLEQMTRESIAAEKPQRMSNERLRFLEQLVVDRPDGLNSQHSIELLNEVLRLRFIGQDKP